MKKIAYSCIAFLIPAASCNKFLRDHCSKQKINLGPCVISSRHYYNPFTRIYDSVEVFTHNGKETVNVLSVMDIKNKEGTYRCFILDTIKFLECGVYKGRINGSCIEYLRPDCMDTAEYAEFKKSKRHGIYRRYSASGERLFQVEYKNGKVMKGSMTQL